MAGNLPLISCVMPTYGRPEFVPEAVAMFLDQDYPAKELIVLNDCPGQVFHSDRPDIRVINSPVRFPTLGEKRNASIELARGEYIAIWDDDDLYLPWRLSHSLSEAQFWRTELYRPACFYAYSGQEKLLDCNCTHGVPSHGTILFRKAIWKEVGGYPAIDVGEDAAFLTKVHAHLGEESVKYEVDPIDRFSIMRWKSHYQHMSMDGGSNPLDTSPGDFRIVPGPIADPVLRRAYSRLARLHKLAEAGLARSAVAWINEPALG